MSSDVLQPSIAAASVEVAQSFEQLCTVLNDTACERRAALASYAVEDQLARFRIWAGNIGAFHHPPSNASLDYRLREAPTIATQVHDYLDDLKDCLVTGNAPTVDL